jgi:hypothetical protein
LVIIILKLDFGTPNLYRKDHLDIFEKRTMLVLRGFTKPQKYKISLSPHLQVRCPIHYDVIKVRNQISLIFISILPKYKKAPNLMYARYTLLILIYIHLKLPQ